MIPVLLFAAGRGTRMRHLTEARPKPLISVGGRTLLDHALDLVDLPGIARPVVNLHMFPDQIRAHLKGRDIAYSDETDSLLETGGGLRKALPLLGKGGVITLNTDAVWKGPNPVEMLISAWQPQMEALLLTIPPGQAVGHPGQGDFLRDQDGRLSRGPGEIYSGLQMIRPDLLHDIPQTAFSMNVAWDLIAERKGLFGTSYTGRWCDVGQPESIPMAEEMLRDV